MVGNSIYLSDTEAQSSPSKTLTRLATLTRRFLPRKEIFIGTEGAFKISLSLAKRYNLNPFLLLDRSLQQDIEIVRREIPEAKIAVYTPYFISDKGEDAASKVLISLGPYIVRRKWVKSEMKQNGYQPNFESVRELIKLSEKKGESPQEHRLGRILLDCASKLAIYGNASEVTVSLHTLLQKGVNLIVGFPIDDCDKQVTSFGRCVRAASSS